MPETPLPTQPANPSAGNRQIQRVLVLGGGSAGFLAAITLKTRLPTLDVLVIRSREIGIIGVGEGTTFKVPDFLHGYLKIPLAEFYRVAQPIWKLGIRFIWGSRPFFDYTFEKQLFSQWNVLPKYNGFYCGEDFTDVSFASALMSRDCAFVRRPDGLPKIQPDVAYHMENRHLVEFLESHAGRIGVRIGEDTVVHVEQDEGGITALRLGSGRSESADLYVDCSGFASVLLAKTLKEPFVSFRSSLFCDRAVVGGWERREEPVQPYTTAETMDSGWCWRIDHETRINRGYVFSSAFMTDEQAEREFRGKNPKVEKTRVVPYVSGRCRDAWVKNVVGIGNASGFVEPLESTSLAAICNDSHTLAELLATNDACAPSASEVRLYNRRSAFNWDSIRRFLAVHYKFNTRLDTPFWRECREKTDLAGAEDVIENYVENGPTPIFSTTLLDQRDQFGMDGYLTMLLGQGVPHRKAYVPSPREQATWMDIRQRIAKEATNGFSVPEALRLVRSPQWIWPQGIYRY